MSEYFIKPPFDQRPKLITMLKRDGNRELINLAGKTVKETVPARRNMPEREVEARGATQEDLRFLVEDDPGNWDRMIGKRAKASTAKTDSKGAK